MLGERAEKVGVIDFLKGLAAKRVAADLANQQHDRGRILRGNMNTRGRVGCPGAACYKTDARPARQFGAGLGHHGGTAFLATDHGSDPWRVLQRIKRCKITFTGDTKDVLYFLRAKRIDQDLASTAASRSVRGRHVQSLVGFLAGLSVRADELSGASFTRPAERIKLCCTSCQASRLRLAISDIMPTEVWPRNSVRRS